MSETVTIPANVWKNTLVKIDALAAENERLRKAGDAVVLCFCGDTNEKHKERCAINWLAAKEGRDAK